MNRHPNRASRRNSGITRKQMEEHFWLCPRCRTWVWHGAFRHKCRDPASGQPVILEHAHDVDAWREQNPTTPCPCHGERDVLLAGTFRPGRDPRELIVPARRKDLLEP